MFRRLVGFLMFLILLGAVTGAIVATGLAAVTGPGRWAVIGVTVVALVGFALLVRWMFSRTWAPVGALIDATRRLGEGDPTVRLRETPGGPFRAVATSFNKMAGRLEEEEERRRRLLADLGHELRTPLTVIRGEIEAVIDGVHPAGELLHVITEVELMERLLEDLRLLALAEAGRLDLHEEQIDPEHLIQDVVKSFSTTLDTQGIETMVRVGASPEITGDPQRIRQVLGNLVSNAINHMPDGGRLGIDVNIRRSDLIIEVSDTGSGIPEDRLDSIFDRFARADDSAGAGLGLAIARDLAMAHGGSLTARNREPQGAVFTVTLPLRRP